jgi:hypothetical protein
MSDAQPEQGATMTELEEAAAKESMKSAEKKTREGY